LNATARSCATRCTRLALGPLLAFGAGGRALYAASATPFAAPVQQVTTGSAAGLLRVVLALIVVLAAVLAAAWLARRMRALSGGGSASLQILAQLPLGTRERAVLVRVGDCQVLIGVAPGHVSTLHVLERPAELLAETPMAEAGAAQAPQPARPTFKAILLRSLGK